MFEGLLEHAFGFWTYIQGLLQRARDYLSTSAQSLLDNIRSLEPNQKLVLWIQLIVGLLTIVWIIFQFAWLRRLNEARLERHLESTISTERDEATTTPVARASSCCLAPPATLLWARAAFSLHPALRSLPPRPPGQGRGLAL